MKQKRNNFFRTKSLILFTALFCISIGGFAQTEKNEKVELSPEMAEMVDNILLKYGTDAEAAKAGDKKAIIRLADEYNKRQIKSPEAIEMYLKAAEAGEVKYMKKIGNLYMQGGAVGQDYSKAIFWHKKAAEKGDAEAMVSVGYIYLYGFGDVGKDATAAEMWFDKARKTDATVESDIRTAKYAIENKTSDFINLHIEAKVDAKKAVELGDMYAKEKDYETAEYWYQKAIAAGGQQANIAQEHLNQIINKGNTPQSSTQLIEVPDHLRGGNVVTRTPQNSAEAEKEFNNASKQLAQAVNTPLDPNAELRKKAEAGNTDAMLQLARILNRTKDGEKEAYNWYLKAANNGNTDAMLGLYFNASMKPKEQEKWLNKAKDAGNINAKYYYGKLMYKKPQKQPHSSDPTNYIIATTWLNAFLKYTPEDDNSYMVKDAKFMISDMEYAIKLATSRAESRQQHKQDNKEYWAGLVGQGLQNAANNLGNSSSSSYSSSQSSGDYIYRVKYSSGFINMKKSHAQMAGQSWNGPYQKDFNTEEQAINHLKEIFNSYDPPETYGLSGKNYTWVGTIEKIKR